MAIEGDGILMACIARYIEDLETVSLRTNDWQAFGEGVHVFGVGRSLMRDSIGSLADYRLSKCCEVTIETNLPR